MKNIKNLKLVVFLSLLFSTTTYSQLYVGTNSYVFVDNQFVFVKNALELNGASNFYLRNDAQLLQGSSVVGGANKGLGSLSVFQEGTTNNFAHNTWCSPVGSSNETAGNSPFGITQLKDVVDLTTFTTPTILAMNQYDGIATPLSIAPYWIQKLLSSSSYYSWQVVGSNSTINPGEGFTMKGTSGTNTTVSVNGIPNNPGSAQRYDFRGKPNDGDIIINVANAQFTLTGNPYPSAIDLSKFLTDATNSTGIAYFWEQDPTTNSHLLVNYKAGYGTFSPISRSGTGIYVPAVYYKYTGAGDQIEGTVGSGTTFDRQFSPIGQGFMIEGNNLGSTVIMKNSHRVFVKEGLVNNSQFARTTGKTNAKNSANFLPNIPSVSGFDYTTVSTLPTPQIRINTLMNNQGVRQLNLAFVPEATTGVDHAMDAASPSDAPVEIYFAMNNGEYIIDARPFDIDSKIAIGFRNNAQANYKITVNEFINFTDANEVYLHDKSKDMYFDIKNSFYDLTLPAGVNNNQFEITFKNKSTLGIENQKSENFVVYQNNTSKNLTISNPKSIAITNCSLYDVVGKLIFSKKDLGTDTSYTFPTSNLSDGIYIVKIGSSDQSELGKKIIIKN